MRIALCVPSGDDVKADFWLSFSDLLTTALADGHVPLTLNVRTSLITNSRYVVVRDALTRDVDKVFFVDSDMVFPGDALRRLVARDKPIVGATYARRREPWGALGYGVEDVPPGAVGLARFARLPLGMMLIDASVFATVPKPWFPSIYRPETEDFESEDYGFCRLAIEAGYDVWCDLDLSHEMGHIGQTIHMWGRAEAPHPTLPPESDRPWSYDDTPVGQQAARLRQAIEKCR